jgi:hypothetical protein
MIATFEAAGFSECAVENRFLADEAYVEEFVLRLRASGSPYRDLSQDDLRVLGARLVLRK